MTMISSLLSQQSYSIKLYRLRISRDVGESLLFGLLDCLLPPTDPAAPNVIAGSLRSKEEKKKLRESFCCVRFFLVSTTFVAQDTGFGDKRRYVVRLSIKRQRHNKYPRGGIELVSHSAHAVHQLLFACSLSHLCLCSFSFSNDFIACPHNSPPPQPWNAPTS